MKLQRKAWDCGIASVANALECIGIRRTQGQIAKLCHVNPVDGTSEDEIKRAILASGAVFDEWDCPDEDASHAWLRQALIHYGPVIACVDQLEHWVVVIGLCADNFVVFDSSLGAGLRVYTWEGLKTRWCVSRRKDGPMYFAFSVSEVGNDFAL